MEIRDNTPSQYPSHFVMQKVKKDKPWCLQYAKAFEWNFRNNGIRLFYNNRTEMQENIDILFGKESTKYYKDIIDYGKDHDDKSSFISLDWRPTNFQYKYLNRVLSKLSEVDYNIRVGYVDNFSDPIQDELRQKLEAYEKIKTMFPEVEGMYKDVGSDLAKEVTGYETDKLPNTIEEKEYFIASNSKNYRAMAYEIILKAMNEYSSKERVFHETDFDSFMHGYAAIKVSKNTEGFWTYEKVDVFNLAVGYSNKEDFSDIQEVGEYSMITINQLRKEYPEITEDEVNEIIKKYQYSSENRDLQIQDSRLTELVSHPYDNFRVPIFRFYCLSADEQRYVERKNQYGNEDIMQKNQGYYKGKEKEYEQKYKGERNINVKNDWNIYQGTWVLDTEIIYNYGLCTDMPKGNDLFEKPPLPIIIVAPNIKKGKIVSPFSQIVQCIRNVNIARFKMQHAIATSIPNITAINFEAMEAVAEGSGGIINTPQEGWDLFLKTGKYLYKTRDVNGDVIENRPIDTNQQGIGGAFQEYIGAIAHEIEMINQILGMSESDGEKINPELTLGVATMQQSNTNAALDYLFYGKQLLYQNVNKYLCKVIPNMIDTLDEGKMSRIFGSFVVRYLKETKEDSFTSYGCFIEKKPSKQQWESVYFMIKEFSGQGLLDPDDALVAIDFDNLKQLILYIKAKVSRKKKELKLEAQENSKQNAEIQAQAAQQKVEQEIEKMNKKIELVLAQEKEITNRIIQKVLLERETTIIKEKEETQRALEVQDKKIDAMVMEADMYNNNDKDMPDIYRGGIAK